MLCWTVQAALILKTTWNGNRKSGIIFTLDDIPRVGYAVSVGNLLTT